MEARPPSSLAHCAHRSAVRWTRVCLPLAVLAAVLCTLAVREWPPLLELDRRVAYRLHGQALARDEITLLMKVFTDWVWDPWAMRLLLGAAAVWLLVRGERLLALWTVGTAAVTAGVQQALKALLDRPRPQWAEPVDSAHFSALPSGHAMTAAVSCALLLWLLRRAAVRTALWRLAAAAAAVSVAGVCFTRVWLGVHWLSDTVSGVLLGTACAAAAVGAWHALAVRRAANGARPETGRDAGEESGREGA